VGSPLSVLSDAPVDLSLDLLHFDRYAGPLVDVIVNDATETPFTIGVFGAWGSGKSSLLGMVDQKLAEKHAAKAIRVHFNPWIHRGEPTMLVPLLHTIRDTLARDRRARFADAAQRIGTVITALTMDVLLRRVSGGAVSVERIQEQARAYAEHSGEVESEIRGLRMTLQEQVNAVTSAGARLIIFVDDLDRCEPAEIIGLLESMKLFLDLRNVIVILAIAKDVVDRGVALRYREFGFDADATAAIGDEYLDKMVQLPLYLPPMDASVIGGFIRRLDVPDSMQGQVELLKDIVAPNPRRIKRVLNMCALTLAIAQRSGNLKELRPDLVTRLVVLRMQSPELYAAAALRPQLLVALEDAYGGALNVGQTEGFVTRYGTAEAESMQAAVRRFYDSQDFLQGVFAQSAFAEVADNLPAYFTMLGE
jgi:hypothetical protein